MFFLVFFSFFLVFLFLIYRMSLLMEAVVTDIKVPIDFVFLAIHKAVEQEVRHGFIGSATELKWTEAAVDAVDRNIRPLFVSIRPQLHLHTPDNFHREMTHPTAIWGVAHDNFPYSVTGPT